MPRISPPLAVGLLVLAVGAAPDDRPAKRPPAGTIRGRLIWADAVLPAEPADPSPGPASDRRRPGLPPRRSWSIDPTTRGIADGVAYLVRPQGDFAAVEADWLARNPEVVIGQAGGEIVPPLAIVHRRQQLRFRMDEPAGHALAVAAHPPIGLPLPSADPEQHSLELSREVRRSQRPLPVGIVCTIHPGMTSYALNVDHPFAAPTQADGSFEIPGVPAGEQHLIVWHPQRGCITAGGVGGQVVAVRAGSTADVGDLPVRALPAR